MHATFFRMKRALHASLRIGRMICERWPPLTPARFDLLYIIHQSAHGWIRQTKLTEMLGLHPSTVSKMLKRLVELKLIFHSMDEDDHRQKYVSLTPDGRRLMDHATQEILGGGFVDHAVANAILPLRWYDDARVRKKIARINGTLRRYALTFYDTATALYASRRPDDAPEGPPMKAARWERRFRPRPGRAR